jgi:hypothetical protein
MGILVISTDIAGWRWVDFLNPIGWIFCQKKRA